MAQTFSFGFNNEDIENDKEQENRMDRRKDTEDWEKAQAIQPQLHTLVDLLSTLPSCITYTSHPIPGSAGEALHLPRRDLFDIRAQLMAEDPSSGTSSIAGLSTDDITPKIYEGGFKTWECAVDLAGYLSENFDMNGGIGDRHIIELGAGTALPTLALLHSHLVNPPPNNTKSSLRLTFSDYNRSVLELATVPNLLLTWYTASHPFSPQEGALEITPDVVSSFLTSLSENNILVDAISGSWGPAFSDLLLQRQSPFKLSREAKKTRTIVLASETIYHPSSIQAFTRTLLAILTDAKHRGDNSSALVAAKKVYFGVGGGVYEFLTVLQQEGGTGDVVWETGGKGVGRVIFQVLDRRT